MINIIRALILPILLTLATQQVLAHGADKPLFVSPDGLDGGLCDNPSRPCRSISHALKVAGKGTEVRVAAGTYAIEHTEDLFHMVSGIIEVSGGYRRQDNFTAAGSGISILTGVPVEFRDELRKRGFHVITDRKGIDKGSDDSKSVKTRQLLDQHQKLASSLPATPCNNGSADGLACEAVDLLSHMAFQDISAAPTAANDVWGFVDLNTNREYLIVGYNIGTAVIDVTNPELPREVGFIDGQDAVWRDIKVLQLFDTTAGRWRAYAYVTTDGSTDGLFVVDLSGLPHAVSRGGYSSDFFSAHNVYASGIDFSTGISLAGANPSLIVAGSDRSGGQYRSYALADPASPAFVGGAANASDYMHDAASILVTDSRKDTQCINAGAYCEVLLDFNESTVDLWDITLTASPQRLSRTPYTNSGYTHSGWPSEDGKFLFLHDELDEQRFGLNTTLRVFSLASFAAPVLVGSWTGMVSAIDHNGFVRGNRYYMSNYSRGLTVLDISNPAMPVEAGFLDTYPFSNGSSFVGAWGVYPYLHSRIVAISDINSGLYLVADRTLDVSQGRLSFAAASFAVTEGNEASLPVQRIGGSVGDISVDYQLIPATATGDDFATASGTLSWNAGDSSARAIDITAISDGVNEAVERILVRLESPSGGATLGEIATASLYIGEAGAAAQVALSDSVIDIAERGFGTAVVVLQRLGNASGAVSIDYTMTGGNAGNPADFTGPANGTITWGDGDGDAKWLEFAIVDDGVNETTEYFELTLDNPSGAAITGMPTVRINIENGNGLNRAPNAVATASQSTAGAGALVTLSGDASNDPNGDTLSFEWLQTGGPAVSLANANSPVANFTAPSVQSDTLLQFSLTVSDSGGLSDVATTSVVVTVAGTSGGSSGGGAVLPLLVLLGFVAAARRRRDTRQTASRKDAAG